jgi:hypothetical protein
MNKVLLMSIFAVAAAFVTSTAKADDFIVCESQNYQPNTCYYNGGRNAIVHLEQQLSHPDSKGGVCSEGRDWYSDGNAIRVFNGCRAQFRIIQTSQYITIPCDSWNNAPMTCQLPRGIVQNVRLVEQRSRPKRGMGECLQGRDWTYDRDNLFVRNGCRASFEVEVR